MAKRKKAEIEVRRDPPTRACPEGEIDEVCGHGQFHLERMGESEFALMLYGEKGDTMCVWFHTKRKLSRKGGQLPHVRVTVGWHDTPETQRQFRRDFKACQRDPIAYVEMMRRRRRELARSVDAVDPHAGSTGKLSPRDGKSLSSIV